MHNPLTAGKRLRDLEEKVAELSKPRTRKCLLSFGASESQSYLVASTEMKNAAATTSIRGILQGAKLISESVQTLNLSQMAKVNYLPASGVTVPEDFYDYADYQDAFDLVPYVNRAVMVKHAMIWQNGYDIDLGGKNQISDKAKATLAIIDEEYLRDGSLYAKIFGNMYWHKNGDVWDPLNPMLMGVKLSQDKKTLEQYVYTEAVGKKVEFKPEEIWHLKFNCRPWDRFGVSCLRNILPCLKAILYMEKKLPWLARRLAHPLLQIDLGDADHDISEEDFKKVKGQLETRPDGSDIYNDGTILKIEEVYKNIGNSRQMIEPVLKHFENELIGGLGVPEIALGVGGTTTMATAEYQERLLEAEVRDDQRRLKRFYQANVFKAAGVPEMARLVWRPLKAEDVYRLSEKLCREIEHGIISPASASKKLGYLPDDLKGAVMNTSLASAPVQVSQ